MKKRLISLLLTLVMLVSLCSVFTVSASADSQTTTVTLASGDTVIALCQKYGIDYYTYKNVIMSLNGITSEAQFRNLAVGTQITLPVSNTAAASLAGTTTTAATTTGTATVSGLTTGTVSSLPTGDYVAYYLVNYTIKSGETIGGIYSSLGESYKTYQNQIVSLNNLANINTVMAGKTLLLPTTSASLSGSAYKTVVAHVMKSGDTAQALVTNSYGQNWSSSYAMLQKLNNRTNLNYFRTGEVMYIPVDGIVTINNNTSNGSSNTSGSVVSGTSYSIVRATATNGSFDVRVSGSSVSQAASGQTVQIVATPDTGYAVSSVTVTKSGDSSTAVSVSNNSFVMPAYSVNVSVSFEKAVQSKITVESAYNGGVAATVSGEKVTQAYSGSQVVVKATPKNGFELEHIRVTYNDGRDTVAVENGVFTMPSFPVTVTATFKAISGYKPVTGSKLYIDAANAAITATVDGKEAEYIEEGKHVTLSVKTDDGYTLESVRVYDEDYNEIEVDDNLCFTMPEGPVNVVAAVKPTAEATLALSKITSSGDEGTFTLKVDGKETATAKPGQTVSVEGKSSLKLKSYTVYVTKTGDESVGVEVNQSSHSFTMPDYPVTVRVEYHVYHNITIDKSNSSLGAVSTSISSGAEGDGVTVSVRNIKKGYGVSYIKLTYKNSDGTTATDFLYLDNTYFTMPDADVLVRVEFSKLTKLTMLKAVSTAADGITDRSGVGNSYTVDSNTVSDSGKDKEIEAAAGKIYITANPVTGYEVSKISYTIDGKNWPDANKVSTENNKWYIYLDSKSAESSSNVKINAEFAEMETIPLQVTFTGEEKDIVDGKRGNDGGGFTDPDGKGSVWFYASSHIVWTASENSKITLSPKPSDGYKFDSSKVKVYYYDKSSENKTDITFDATNNTFTVPKNVKEAVIVDLSGCFAETKHAVYIDTESFKLSGNSIIGKIEIKVGDRIYTAEELNGGNVKFEAGTKITVISTAYDEYTLKETEPISVLSKESGLPVPVTIKKSGDNTCYFTMPYEAVKISAIFTESSYSIVVADTEHGTYEGPTSGVWNLDTGIFPVPDEGYVLKEATYTYTNADGNVITETVPSGMYIPKFTAAPKSDVTLNLVFEAKGYTLTVTGQSTDAKATKMVDISVNGTILSSTDGEAYDVPANSVVTVTRHQTNKDLGCTLETVVVNDGVIPVNEVSGSSETFTFTMPAADAKMVLTFKDINSTDCNISASVTHATLETSSLTVPQSEVKKQVMLFKPDDGYTVDTSKNAKLTWKNIDDTDGSGEAAVQECEDKTNHADMYKIVLSGVNGLENVKPGTTVTVSYECTGETVSLGTSVENSSRDDKAAQSTLSISVDNETVEKAEVGSTVTVSLNLDPSEQLESAGYCVNNKLTDITEEIRNGSMSFKVPAAKEISFWATVTDKTNNVTINVEGNGVVKRGKNGEMNVKSGELTKVTGITAIVLAPENENQEMNVSYTKNSGEKIDVKKNDEGKFVISIDGYEDTYIVNVKLGMVRYQVNAVDETGKAIVPSGYTVKCSYEAPQNTFAGAGDTLTVVLEEGKSLTDKIDFYYTDASGKKHSTIKDTSITRSWDEETKTWTVTIPKGTTLGENGTFSLYVPLA